MEAKKIVDLVVRAAEEHKGIDLEILDVSQLTIVADYFVVVSGRSTLHVDALTKAILDEIEANGVPVKNR
ncbi:MAG TPA: RsfS/YbeB/iojap family protein, partial [Bacillota bacterium]|nr:RsfS/YbeB/iojap family protein [Bacillota bacterium]